MNFGNFYHGNNKVAGSRKALSVKPVSQCSVEYLLAMLGVR